MLHYIGRGQITGFVRETRNNILLFLNSIMFVLLIATFYYSVRELLNFPTAVGLSGLEAILYWPFKSLCVLMIVGVLFFIVFLADEIWREIRLPPGQKNLKNGKKI